MLVARAEQGSMPTQGRCRFAPLCDEEAVRRSGCWFGGDLGQAVAVLGALMFIGVIGVALTAATRGRELQEAKPLARTRRAPSARR
jgi:hypothetical protein